MKHTVAKEEDEEEPLVLTRRMLRRQSMRAVSQTGMIQAPLGKLDDDSRKSLARPHLNHFTNDKKRHDLH